MLRSIGLLGVLLLPPAGVYFSRHFNLGAAGILAAAVVAAGLLIALSAREPPRNPRSLQVHFHFHQGYSNGKRGGKSTDDVDRYSILRSKYAQFFWQ